MEDMDSSDVNPLKLSLDEIIALNKTKEESDEEESSQIILSTKPNVNGFTNQNNFSSDAISVNKRLRNIPGFGSKPIHHRLGYNNFKFQRRRPMYNPKAELMRRSIQRARLNAFRRGRDPVINPQITFKNEDAVRRLLQQQNQSVLMKINRQNYSGFIGNSFGPSRTMKPQRFRLSNFLNPAIHEQLQALSANIPPFDSEMLEGHELVIEGTGTTLNERFSSYE